mmetsp:Transcript_12585/g.41484  ORF Transcript_12585/g.41484 Transcript_12585/m.41484 type:complete len:188 (+) Transcript_12585:756-1319(+)
MSGVKRRATDPLPDDGRKRRKAGALNLHKFASLRQGAGRGGGAKEPLFHPRVKKQWRKAAKEADASDALVVQAEDVAGARRERSEQAEKSGEDGGGSAVGGAEVSIKRGRKKHTSGVQKAYERAQAEREEEQRLREERRREAAEHQRARDSALKTRRDERKLHEKRTAKGQPVMKHRLSKLLDKLEK